MDDDQLALTRSLEVEIRTGFALPSQPEGLAGEALMGALSELSVPQNQALRAALAESGEELIASEPAAVLDWIDAVFTRWHAHYSLDPELEQLLLAAKPLAAALPVQKIDFLRLGPTPCIACSTPSMKASRDGPRIWAKLRALQ